MSETVASFGRPSFSLALLEAGRALSELSLLPVAEVPLKAAPSGDGHPVIVCPGFLTSDRATSFLRRFISSKGYETFGWELGRNFGPGSTGGNFELLADKVHTAYQRSGRKVSLVGWSLGGVMARELAKQFPDQIRQVITLGSPLSGKVEASTISWLYNQVAGQVAMPTYMQDIMERLSEPPADVPSTSIFTKTDGIVHWRGCIEPKRKTTDNIEVYASHCGLGVNPIVYFAIADRLALPENEWSPFDRKASMWRRAAFPSSGHEYH
ncbi:MAG: alpha/beta fold hydrolase [Pseudomonadota bacterium]